MKKLRISLLTGLLCLVLSSCGYQRPAPDADEPKPDVTALEVMDEVSETIRKKSKEDYTFIDLFSPEQTEYFFPMKFLDLEDMEEGYAMQGRRVTQSALVILVKAHDAKSSKRIEEQMSQLLSEQMSLWADYLPEQYDHVKNNEIEREGDFVIYITSQYADAIKETFEKAVR